MFNEILSMLEENQDMDKKIIEQLVPHIEKATKLIVDCYKNKRKVVLFGNGGSAAQAQHIAAEFMNKFKIERRPLPAIAFTVDTSILTSIANDSGYEEVFSKQAEAYCEKGDIAIAITTSDFSEKHSANIKKGIEAAKEKGATVIGMLSTKGEKVGELVDLAIKVPSRDTARIQEAHIMILHIICELVEKEIFS